MVRVRTRSGRILTGTPNHPVLTSQGWVALGLLDEGAYVIRDREIQRMLLVDPNDYQKPAFIEEIAGSLRQRRGVLPERVPLSPEDFHGDGSHGYVYVVDVNGPLGNGVQVSEPNPERLLGRTSRVSLSLSGLSDGASVPPGLLPTPNCGVRRGSVPLILLGGTARRTNAVRLSLAAGLKTILPQPSVNDTPADAKTARDVIDALASPEAIRDTFDLRDFLRANSDTATSEKISDSFDAHSAALSDGPYALARFVAEDQIVSVERFPWSGHVYNLETSGGWYTANGIIAHNCRCSLVPWKKEWVSDVTGPPLPTLLRQRARTARRS